MPAVPKPGSSAPSSSNLASALLRRGDVTAAEDWARGARARDPGSADAAFNLGLSLRRQDRNAEAVEPVEAAMRLEPDYTADALAELGAIRALLGDPLGARALLEQALVHDPAHADARRYLQNLSTVRGE